MSTPVSPVATPLLLVPEFGDDCGSDDDDDNAHGTRLQLIACRRNITSSRRRRARLAHGTISRTSIAVDPRVQCAVRKPKLKATGQTGHTQTSWVVWAVGSVDIRRRRRCRRTQSAGAAARERRDGGVGRRAPATGDRRRWRMVMAAAAETATAADGCWLSAVRPDPTDSSTLWSLPSRLKLRWSLRRSPPTTANIIIYTVSQKHVRLSISLNN